MNETVCIHRRVKLKKKPPQLNHYMCKLCKVEYHCWNTAYLGPKFYYRLLQWRLVQV